MTQFLSYLFWPNLGTSSYTEPKMLVALIVSILLIVGSFGISAWRKKQKNQSLRKLSKSWSIASFWFGLIGLVLTVARVEGIQFVMMRIWWILTIILAVLYVAFQVRSYRRNYYEVIPVKVKSDPRSKYLPKRKRK